MSRATDFAKYCQGEHARRGINHPLVFDVNSRKKIVEQHTQKEHTAAMALGAVALHAVRVEQGSDGLTAVTMKVDDAEFPIYLKVA